MENAFLLNDCSCDKLITKNMQSNRTELMSYELNLLDVERNKISLNKPVDIMVSRYEEHYVELHSK